MRLKVRKKVDFKRTVTAQLLAVSAANPSVSSLRSAKFVIKAGKK